MAEEGNEWELSKENVQPLKKGRAMSTLQEVLTLQESSHHPAIQQQKLAFEQEIRSYTGDDPLDVWDRYVRWAEQAFPHGGKESILPALVERAVKVFHEEKKYFQDLRYLNFWLKFANACSEPLDLYSYLHSQEIGTTHAELYITWAEVYEARGNHKKADSIFQEGLQRKAEPVEKLQCRQREFQARLSRQVLQGMNEGDPDVEDSGLLGASEPQRSSLADLKCRGKKKARAPVTRVGEFVKPARQVFGIQFPAPQQVQAGPRFQVFQENEEKTHGAELQELTPQQWVAPPPARAKENELGARPWNSGRTPRSTQASAPDIPHPLPSFTPFVEESAQQQFMTPCKINPSLTCVLSARKATKEEDPLQRVQSCSQNKEEQAMYCKSKVNAGLEEFSFEEIRADNYLKKIQKKREEKMQASIRRRNEMAKMIEEMEKQLMEAENKDNQHSVDQFTESSTLEAASKASGGAMSCLDELDHATPLSDCLQNTGLLSQGNSILKSNQAILQEEVSVQLKPSESISAAVTVHPSLPFTIFDESNTRDTHAFQKEQEPNQMKPSESISPAMTVHPSLPFKIFDESEPSALSTKDNQDVKMEQELYQMKPSESISTALTVQPSLPFTIFDECDSSASSNTRIPEQSVRRSLTVYHDPSNPLADKDRLPGTSSRDISLSSPNEHDTIVNGSDGNKTLFPVPEDTCAFASAAPFSSTPFHTLAVQRDEVNEDSERLQQTICATERKPLSVKALNYNQAPCNKKLSPILEASQEDNPSNSSASSSASSLTVKSLTLPANGELGHSFHTDLAPLDESSNGESSGEPSRPLWCIQLRKQLLEPLSDLNSSALCRETEPMPAMDEQEDVTLGGEIYSLNREVKLGEDDRLLFGVLKDTFTASHVKGVALKVCSQPVPWDFHITHVLKERLGEEFDQYFMKCSCLLYTDGCVVLYQDINKLSTKDLIQDLIQDLDSTWEALILLLTHCLISLVEKLHSVDIVHGNLHPDTLLLGDRIVDSFSSDEQESVLKLVDFSHSLDLRLHPQDVSITGFPRARSEQGQQILSQCSSPYQVDMLGIADTLHFMIFRKPLRVEREGSRWELSERFHSDWNNELWTKIFTKLLNADGEPTVSLLQELKGEISQLLDSEFQDRLSQSLFDLQLVI
ncbi:mitotic checkpoint serine/threonine-protein kinase BUB1 beta [Pleurodeles waltl]